MSLVKVDCLHMLPHLLQGHTHFAEGKVFAIEKSSQSPPLETSVSSGVAQ
jgi:hypothetical protein